MIWVGGRIVPDDALRISALDRTFEHGLGLFETLRTWDGHATLLGRHLDRMADSARQLRLPLDPAALPDADAVAALLRADGAAGDATLRITLTGGLSEAGGSVLWMIIPCPGTRP
jgi:branched-subunit amino acid aminotransferase/4-amino-4-deoxychorismate lyase